MLWASDKVGLRHSSASVTLELFSSLNDSEMLFCFGSHPAQCLELEEKLIPVMPLESRHPGLARQKTKGPLTVRPRDTL